MPDALQSAHQKLAGLISSASSHSLPNRLLLIELSAVCLVAMDIIDSTKAKADWVRPDLDGCVEF